MSAQSIFSLRKTDGSEQIKSEVRTVNFINHRVESEEIKGYFDSRIRFLGACYDFAKEKKLREDFNFADNSVTRDKLRQWLSENRRAVMVEGTEFGVITTKVQESIASIEKNKYLQKLQEELKEIVWKKQYGEKVDKKELKKLTLSLDDLESLEEEEIKEIFNYTLVEKAKMFRELLILFKNEDILVEKCESVIGDLDIFLERMVDSWQKAFQIVKNSLKSENIPNKDLAEFFVLKLFFAFDGRAREIEDDLLPVINSSLNEIKQGFAQQLLEKVGESQESEKDIQEERGEKKRKNLQLQNIWDLDWTRVESVSIFNKSYQKILYGVDSQQFPGDKKETIEKEKSEFALNHPKSAPNFPSLREKTVDWDSDKKVSVLLEEKKDNFDELKFLDYLLFRAKKIIEGSDVYKIWRFIGNHKDYVWTIWLKAILGQQEIDFSSGSNLLNKNHEYHQVEENYPGKDNWRIIKFKKNSGDSQKTEFGSYYYKEKLSKDSEEKPIIRIMEFVWSDGKQNHRLPKITFNLNKKDGRQVANFGQWMERHYLDLAKFNIELAILRDLQEAKLLDLDFIQKWLELLTTEEGLKQKLSVRTEKRLSELKKQSLKPILKKDEVLKVLTIKLEKLEKHLLLDRDHQEFKIFDKSSYSKYKKLAQIIFESVLGEDKIRIAKEKADLAKLGLETKQVLPIKIGRMTKRTNGSSTLIFDLDSEQNLAKESYPSVVFPLIKLHPNLQEYSNLVIKDSLEKAVEEFNKPKNKDKYQKIAVGFLNGDKDNNLREVQSNFFENDKSFESLSEDSKSIKLIYEDEQRKVMIRDDYVKPEDVLGGNNPGYPRLYYFLIPKNCNNLIIPVKTNWYYLTKYTPYHHLRKYLYLDKELCEHSKSENEEKWREKAEEILHLRCHLRRYYRISSLELDLIRDYNLKIDRQTKTASIEPFLQAKVHFQFSNPRKIADVSNLLSSKPKYVLSVDLGEKILAAVTLSKVDWDKWEHSDFKLFPERKDFALTPVLQSFLPLKKEDLDLALSMYQPTIPETLIQKSSFQKTYSQKNQNQLWLIDPRLDRFSDRYKLLIKRYKSQQKQFGVVQKRLANSKQNLTDKLAEQIAIQIVKLAKEYGAIVVFEDLATGFGREVETVRLYTTIRRLTAQKLGEVGLLNTSFVQGEADLDNYKRYEYNQGLYSLVNPANTSKTCSVCGYLPVAYKEASTKREAVEGVKMNFENWQEKGQVYFTWKDAVFFTIKAPTKEAQTWEFINHQGKNIKDDLGKIVVFSKKNTSNISSPLLDQIKDWLFTSERGDRRGLNEKFLQFALKSFLNSRETQDKFCCKFCGQEENADYQAGYSVGYNFLVGNRVVQERRESGAKDAGLKKGISKEIRNKMV
jgi:hypothetical protein